MSVFKNEKIWRWITDLWTVAFVLFIIWDFFTKGGYDFLIAPLSVVYISILGLYVGTKEFDRWYEFHDGRHPGEWFVIGWTAVIFGLIIASFFLGKAYTVPTEAVADYIMVLSVFALTQKSKQLRQRQLTCPPCPYCGRPIGEQLLKKRTAKRK
jgi:hypothetical protein